MLKTSCSWLITALCIFSLSTAGNAVVTSSSPISNVPLGTGTGVSIPPNIYFVFDDSGSMSWEYLPDYVDDKYCFDSVAFGNLGVNTSTPPSITGTGTTTCVFSNPPYNSADFNFIAYNPKIQYVPATDYDKTNTVYVSQTRANTNNWTNVTRDKYGVLFKNNGTTTSTNLVTNYPDEKYCRGSSTTDCRTNASGYQYPDVGTYTTRRSTTGAPYYYTMAPAFYCTDYTGTSCQSTQDSNHTEPFNFLWCTAYTASTSSYSSNCQALRDGTHVVPTFLGKTVTATPAPATGSITVSPDTSYLGDQLTGITVNGNPLISGTITGTVSDTANSMAVAICNAVHAFSATSGYDCTTPPTSSTVNLIATANGSAYNGNIVATGPNAARVITNAVGSFQIGNTPSTSTRVTGITVGSTQLLASTVIGTATQNATARALCDGINANSSTSQYRARVVAALGGTSPAWGSSGACTTGTTGTYIEIQSQINDVSENGKAITISGPTAANATATITIAGSRFSLGTRPGNVGAISVSVGGNNTTLFNRILSTNTTTVTNSNSVANIDPGMRSVWTSPSGYTLSGNSGSLIITAPAGSAYNGAAITVNAGVQQTGSLATSTFTISAGSTGDKLTGLTCSGTDVITSGSYVASGSSDTDRRNSIAAAINGKGINGYTVVCTDGRNCTVTAPSALAACTKVRRKSESTASISASDFTVGTVGTDNLALALSVGNSSRFSNTGADGTIPITNIQAMAGFSDLTVGGLAVTTVPFTGGAGGTVRTNVGNFTRHDIIDDGTLYTKHPDRSDCVTTAGQCTYDEEMTNFANWYAYYQTRCDTMKTGVLRSFAAVGDDKRVGFNDIYDADHMDVASFTSGVSGNKKIWFDKVASKACSGGGTPLQRGLSAAGRYYAGVNHTTNDPIQYSCQKNYTILSTDGYWNSNLPNTPIDARGGTIGDLDSATGINTSNALPNKPEAPYRDAHAVSGTLADVAKWYYDNDLRNGPDSINSPSHGNGIATTAAGAKAHYSNADVKPTDTDPATWQHMVTFTLGLGMDGLLHYDPNYLNGASADYEAVKAGTKTWGRPGDNKQENVDDLWHAAVNGHGQYFSARDPKTLVTSLNTALSAIDKQVGAAAASATSNMEPVAGDNYLYAASYGTDWTGDLESQTVSVASANAGAVSTVALWSAQAQLQSRDLTTSPRKILTYSSTATSYGKAKELTWDNLSSTERGYFGIDEMSDYVVGGSLATSSGCNTASEGTSPAACSPLLDYLKGSNTGRSAAFRTRPKILGDIVHTKPVFVSNPSFSYADAGYSSWRPTRSKAVYVSANDGMLHAFDGDGLTGGSEKWAYVPSFVLNKIWKIADTNYAANHRFFVDGPITVGDVYINSNWRTVLVAGLGKGGNGYFAIDVTDPDAPQVLWEFTQSNMGYTYGNPEIVKLPDGTWVAIVSSGYNNVPEANGGNAPSGDGVGRLYVINVADGSLMFTMSTGVGSTGNPSNLGKISSWVANASQDNTALYVYAGDMLGNLWRFTMPSTTPASGATLSGYPTVLKIFAAPAGQMITVKPELGSTDGSIDHRMVMFGTGRYLSLDDKTDLSQQSIYGIYDDTLVTNLTTMPAQSDLVQQTLCGQGLATQPAACPTSVPTTYRTTTTNAVPLGLGTGKVRGWYVNLPDMAVGSERANIDPALQLSTLVIASNIPTSSDCNSGGYSYMYFLDYKTGSFVNTSDSATVGLAGVKIANSLVVGQTIVRIGDKVMSLVTRADKAIDTVEPRTSSSGGVTKRVGWREIIAD